MMTSGDGLSLRLQTLENHFRGFCGEIADLEEERAGIGHDVQRCPTLDPTDMQRCIGYIIVSVGCTTRMLCCAQSSR